MSVALACVIACMDFRFQKYIQHWLDKNDYLGQSDEIVVAGCLRDIVKPIKPEHKENLLREIEISIKLHHPQELIFIEHQDCGGYALDNTIASGLSPQEDIEKHHYYAKSAYDEMKRAYPDIDVKIFYVDLKGTFTRLH